MKQQEVRRSKGLHFGSRERALQTSDRDKMTSMIATMQDDRAMITTMQNDGGYKDTSKNEETSWMTRVCYLLSYILTSF